MKDSPTDDYIYPVYSSQTSNYGILGYDNTYDFDGKFLTWTTDGANAGKVFYRNGKFRCTNVCGLLHSNKNNDYINLLTADLLNYETPNYVSYVGNPKLMNNVMADIKIKLPSLEVQNKISHIFSIFDNKLFIEEQKLNNLNNILAKSLLICSKDWGVSSLVIEFFKFSLSSKVKYIKHSITESGIIILWSINPEFFFKYLKEVL